MSTLSPTTGTDTENGEVLATDLLSTDAEVVFHLDREDVMAAAQNSDVGTAIRDLLAQKGMRATTQAVEDAAARYETPVPAAIEG